MEEDGGKRMRGSRSRGRNRGRNTRGRTRGRSKKAVKVIESDEEDAPPQTKNIPMDTSSNAEVEPNNPQVHHAETPQQAHLGQAQQSEQQFDLEADISQLEAPTFTTINRGPPEPMLRLRWDHRVNLIGEKVLNPMIHCCDKCLKPILIYGRMIPCKHVFCLSCAKREDKVCPRCVEKVSRVEQTGLGTVFMCTHGGTRYGNAGCRRTYLSQRDLQAHINHRHVAATPATAQAMQVDTPQYAHTKSEMESQLAKVSSSMQSNRVKSVSSHMQGIMGNDPRVNSIANQQTVEHRQQHHHHHHHHQQQQQHHHHRSQTVLPMQSYSQTSAPPPSNPTMRTNLITVPIQETTMNTHDIHHNQQQSHHYYAPPPQVNYSAYNVPPPVSQTQQQPQQYYAQGQQQQHPGQVTYVSVPQQQQYVSSAQTNIRQQTTGYMHNEQYAPPPPPPLPPQHQQQPPPPQAQWAQHQQQFYR